MNDTILPPTVADREARRWATICHLSALVGLLGNGIGFILAPLIIWLIKRNDHPFLNEQGKEAVNFQLSMLLAAVVSGVLTLVFIGFLLLALVVVLMVVFPIVAAMRASEGTHYRYPLTIRFL